MKRKPVVLMEHNKVHLVARLSAIWKSKSIFSNWSFSQGTFDELTAPTCCNKTKPPAIVRAFKHLPWNISPNVASLSSPTKVSSAKISFICSAAESTTTGPLRRRRDLIAACWRFSTFPFPWRAHNKSHLGDAGSQHIPIPIITGKGIIVAYM